MSETVTIRIEELSDAAIAGLLRIVEAEPNGILLPSGVILHAQPQIRTLDSVPRPGVLNYGTKDAFGAKIRRSVVAVTVFAVIPTSTNTAGNIVAAEIERYLHDAGALDCRVMRIEDKTIKLDKQGHILEVLTHIVETKCNKSN